MKTKRLLITAFAAVLFTSVQVFAQWQSFPSTGLTSAYFIEASNGVLFAGTDAGIYIFNGASWAPMGTGLETKKMDDPEKFLISATGDIYACPDTLRRFNTGTLTWDVVTTRWTGCTSFSEMVTATDTVLFRGAWNDTLWYSSDKGANWTGYASGDSADNNGNIKYVDGLALNWGTRYITKYFAQSSNGWIYMMSKDVVEFSKDGGQNWQWVRGNFKSQNSDNPRGLHTRMYQGEEWLFKATDYSNGSTWTCGKSIVNDTVGYYWLRCGGGNGDGKPLSKGNTFADYDENCFFYLTAGGIHKSHDNGDLFIDFETELPGAPDNMFVMGDTLYANIGTSIYIYNLAALQGWTTDPAATNLANTTVDITHQCDLPGIVYYVVLPSGSAAPSAAQITRGQDAGDNPVVLSGNYEASYSSLGNNTIYGLMGKTAYDAYFVATNEVIDTAGVKMVSFTTLNIGTEDVPAEVDVTVYPNPNNGSFTVETGDAEFSVMVISTVQGQEVLSQPVEGAIEVSTDLPAGTYVLQLKGDGVTAVTKLTIK
jgi:hypothetical protein